jgi:diguanylate cyclase (GGDEF)-like protein/PAS domain S-box-containing protein
LQQFLLTGGWKKLRDESFPRLEGQNHLTGESNLLKKDGSTIPILQTLMVHRNRTGEIDSYSFVGCDISQRRAAEQAARDLALLEQRFSNRVINSLPGIFFLLDDHGCIVRWNQNLEEVLDKCHSGLMNTKLTQFTTMDQHQVINKHLKTGTGDFEIFLRLSDGTEAPFLFSFNPVPDFKEDYLSVIGIGVDISERKAMERELEKRATIDTLTGLYNRRRLEEIAAQFVREAIRYKTPLSVVMFDLDHFKLVNDRHGHDVGDQVLSSVSKRVLGVMRETDILGRWGGEEFVLLAPHSELDEVVLGVERIRLAISESAIGEAGIITASFGVTLLSPEDTDITSILKRADKALYQAKNNGRNQIVASE